MNRDLQGILVGLGLGVVATIPAADAQTAIAAARGRAAPSTLTELVVADRPVPIVDEGALEVAIRKAADPSGAANTARGREMAREGIEDSFRLGATVIIEDTLGLGTIEALRFDSRGNKVGVEQDGRRNVVSVDQQRGWTGWMVANQSGEDNRIVVEQADAALPGDYSRNRAYVGQVSLASPLGSADFRQTAIVRQVHRVMLANVKPNYAAIQQGGVRGSEPGNDGVAAGAIGENNVAQIEQEGAGNDALIQQGVEDARFFKVEYGDTVGRNNRGMVTQVGLGNRAVISQEDDSDAITRQVGADNIAFVRQDGDNDAAAQFSQIEQGSLERDADANFAAVLQNGIGQQSRIFQDGRSGTAVVEQSPTALHASSTLRQGNGSDNFTSVLQDNRGVFFTDGVTSIVTQMGSANSSWTVQRADSSVSLLNQAGAGNTARVSQ